MKALKTVIDNGARVRDALETLSDPAKILRKSVASYEKWCYRDSGLDRASYIPILSVGSTTGLFESVGEVVDRLTLSLRELAARHRAAAKNDPEAMDDLPVLFGIIIADTVTAFVSYDPHEVEGEARNVAVLNWKDDGQDIWNGLAIAILIITVRNMVLDRGTWPASRATSTDGDR